MSREERLQEMLSKWSHRASKYYAKRTPVDTEAYQDLMWILGDGE